LTQSKREIAASVQNISKSFGETSVLNNVTFDVAKGESLVLPGRIRQRQKPRFCASLRDLKKQIPARFFCKHRRHRSAGRERNVGVIFQDYALFPLMTVEQNIAYGLRLRQRSAKK